MLLKFEKKKMVVLLERYKLPYLRWLTDPPEKNTFKELSLFTVNIYYRTTYFSPWSVYLFYSWVAISVEFLSVLYLPQICKFCAMRHAIMEQLQKLRLTHNKCLIIARIILLYRWTGVRFYIIMPIGKLSIQVF